MNKLHFGPGKGWVKPSAEWLTVDVDRKRGDIAMNFNKKTKLPFKNESVSAIYGSHVFEHINIYHAPLVFQECYRVLCKGGFLRIVIPDVRKSICEYLNGNIEYSLFKRRAESLKKEFGYSEVSLFECMRGDFISPSRQKKIFGAKGLAHQNAWDYEAMVLELKRAGFNNDGGGIMQKSFQESHCPDFSFEGTYPSEANEYERSLYIEAKK